jgi:hypothetical protein
MFTRVCAAAIMQCIEEMSIHNNHPPKRERERERERERRFCEHLGHLKLRQAHTMFCTTQKQKEKQTTGKKHDTQKDNAIHLQSVHFHVKMNIKSAMGSSY